MLEYKQDPIVGKRLVCPEALGGCGALTDNDTDDQALGPDWTCPWCGKEWNIHDAENDLMELDE